MFKNKKLLLVLTALIAVTMVLAACGGGGSSTPAPAPDSGSGAGTGTGGDAAPAPAGPDKSKWPKDLLLGSASIGGAYNVYGNGMASVINEVVGIPVTVEVTDGPNHNIKLMEMGDIDLGMVTMGPAYEAWFGLEDWTGGVEHRNQRAIFPMYNTYSQWWASASSGISSIADLDGKRLGIGPASGTSGTFHPRFLELAGINAKLVAGGASDLASSHLDRQLDANSFASGIPVASVQETAAQMKDILMFGVDGALRDKVVEAYPYWVPAQIPASAYPDFLTGPVETVAIGNWATAHKDLPDDLVYEIVKAIMENNDIMVQTHKAAEETVPEAATDNSWFPMHPGAIKYFEEIGIQLHPDVKVQP